MRKPSVVMLRRSSSSPVTLETPSNSRNEFVRTDRFAEDTGKVVQVELVGLLPAYDDDRDVPGLGTGVEFLLHISTAYMWKVQVQHYCVGLC